MKNTNVVKKVLTEITAAVTAATIFSGCSIFSENSQDTDSASIGQGKTLNIYYCNTEFEEIFGSYYVPNADPTLLGGVEIIWKQYTDENNVYQTKLDEALSKQSKIADDCKIDIFLVDMDYAAKYVNSGIAVPMANLGITEDDLKNQYEYTKQAFTNPDGELVGVTWQITPGLYMYRADIAEKVLGTSDPDEVQAQMSDLDKFTKLAAKMNESGYKIVSGYDDMYEIFSNNMTAPWVTDNKISIDPKIKEWTQLTKEYSDKDYNNNTSLLDENWTADMKKDSNVFGYFLSADKIESILCYSTVDKKLKRDNSNAKLGNGLYGQWRACPGPVPYFWGGTGILACQGTDNQELIKDIMLKLTCNTDVMNSIAEGGLNYINNKEVVKQIIRDGYSNPFLGGQNHLTFFDDIANNINLEGKLSDYDNELNKMIKSNMKLYFNGSKTYDQALGSFYNDINKLYPNLTHD